MIFSEKMDGSRAAGRANVRDVVPRGNLNSNYPDNSIPSPDYNAHTLGIDTGRTTSAGCIADGIK